MSDMQGSGISETRVRDEWTRAQTLILIAEYKKHPCLYSPLDQNFTNRVKRNERYNDIFDALSQFKPNVTIREIKCKIRTLQSQLSKERMKINKSKRSGMNTEDVIKPSLWCYNELAFLTHTNDAIPSSSSLELSDIGITTENATEDVVEAVERGSGGRSRGKTRKLIKTDIQTKALEAFEYAKTCMNVQPKPLSKEEQFCNYLCTELHNIKLDSTFRRVKLEILTLVSKHIDEEAKVMEINQQLIRGFRDPNSNTTSTSSLSQFPTSVSSSVSANNPIFSFSPSPIQFSNSTIIKDTLYKPIALKTNVPQSSPLKHHLTESPPIHYLPESPPIQDYLPRSPSISIEDLHPPSPEEFENNPYIYTPNKEQESVEINKKNLHIIEVINLKHPNCIKPPYLKDKVGLAMAHIFDD